MLRRTTPQINDPGAVWDEGIRLYTKIGSEARVGDHEFRWAHLVAGRLAAYSKASIRRRASACEIAH